jgi:CO/xanthine dehydrogenase FAD-binding subunit
MIIEYFRPKTIEEALGLLGREEALALPMGGGTALDRTSSRPFAVVDLQDLPLSGIQPRGNLVEVGATTRLQELLEYPGLPNDLRKAISREASYNLRQVATVAGSLVSTSGRSPLATAILALDAEIVLRPGSSPERDPRLGDLPPPG